MQIQEHPAEGQTHPHSYPPHKTLFRYRMDYAVIFYMYFMQGMVSSIAGTMPYIYPDLPGYKTLAIYSATALPWSFKWIIAPFTQKYNSVTYGKRKTWLVISQLSGGALLFAGGFLTDPSQAYSLALLLLILTVFVVVQDIGLDSFAIKQLVNPQTTSTIQSVAQTAGGLVGGLILLKFTSLQFAHWIGLSQPITSPMVILMCMSALLILPTFVLHFYTQQTILQSQRQGQSLSICQVISYYRVFLDISSKYCRICILFLLYAQGLNFYSAGYDYQLIKKGFSRNTANTVGNITMIPIFFISFFMAGWTRYFGISKAIVITLSIQMVVCSYLLIWFPLDVPNYAITTFLYSVADTWRFIARTMMANMFPVHALSGMFLTAIYSAMNFGGMTTLHTYLIDWLTWRPCAIFGIIVQILIIPFIPKIIEWVDEGYIHFDAHLQQGQNRQGQNSIEFVQETPPPQKNK